MNKKPDVTIYVTTGDVRGAGTDANVKMVLYDHAGNQSREIKLDRLLYDDFERGQTDEFQVRDLGDFGEVIMIEFWRDDFGLDDSWFVEVIRVVDKSQEYVFPVNRWIKELKKYQITQYDCCLPGNALSSLSRRMEIEEKRNYFQYTERILGGPLQIEELPNEETLLDNTVDFTKEMSRLKIQTFKLVSKGGKVENLEELKGLYSFIKELPEPLSIGYWFDDIWFGLQRVEGINPFLITLCKKIPYKLGVTAEMVDDILKEKAKDDSMTLQKAENENRLFIADLEILEDIHHHPDRQMVAPVCLFILDADTRLVPIALQLNQQKATDNPVFLPTDSFYTWTLAKMWYNMAEAQYHMSAVRMGATHILMEGFCICTHRNLSPSHPVFRLLAPHFQNLLSLNSELMERLLGPGQTFDSVLTVQSQGVKDLIVKELKKYRMSLHGVVEHEIESRGVLSREVLPHYPYRDDAVKLFAIIKNYVQKVIIHYYDSDEKLLEDNELLDWRKELGGNRNKLISLGVQGIKGSDHEGFRFLEELVETLTVIIHTCSARNAAVSFPHYDVYSFAPNYPTMLMGEPPKNKLPRSESDVLAALPNQAVLMHVMILSNILSNGTRNTLGNFETPYLYEEAAINAQKQFLLDLKGLSEIIEERNKYSFHPYNYLNPTDKVPNFITI